MQIAYRARDLTEAHIVAGLFASRGIACHVGGHYLQGALGEIGAAGFTNLHVEDEDYALARRLARDYEASRAPAMASGSYDKRPERYARGFLFSLMLLALVFLASSWMGF